MTQIWQMLKNHKLFQIFSSVKLAVPLLIVMAIAVAWGTIVESRYNADIAKIYVYNAKWFSLLMSLLWLNILCAALSRIPWRRHHFGFVTTHIGLLMVLAGGLVSSNYGIDGSLSVPEGQSESMVALTEMVAGLAPEGSQNYQTIEIPKSVDAVTDFEFINAQFGRIFRVERYEPFAEFQSRFVEDSESADLALSFILKSQFFNVTEFLHSRLNPKMKMGPATLELVDREISPPQNQKSPRPKANAANNVLKIIDAKTEKTLKEIAVMDLQRQKKLSVSGWEIEFKKVYRFATVSKEGIQEDMDGGKSNPALELLVRKGSIQEREVLFSKFPGFSLSKSPNREIKFVYSASGELGEGPVIAGNEDMSSGNYVRFRVVDKKKPGKVEIHLLKGGQTVLKKVVAPGETLETPWMGMRITVASIIPGAAQVEDIKPIPLVPGGNLPSGALQIRPASGGGEPLWIPEGETRKIASGERTYSVYFGRKIFRLPFSLELQKFHKVDYPGTETAMSFESDVIRSGQSAPQKISMNEPMFAEGFTIYQSSYQLNPGQRAVSIFSVNRDPGRPLKYWGSLILCLGIVIFTLMRTKIYRRWKGAV